MGAAVSQTLYIKNLAETTTKEDLVRIFLSFQKPAEELRQDRDYLEFRLLQVLAHPPHSTQLLRSC